MEGALQWTSEGELVIILITSDHPALVRTNEHHPYVVVVVMSLRVLFHVLMVIGSYYHAPAQSGRSCAKSIVEWFERPH